MLTSPLLSDLSPAIRHGFFTRQGGVSTGIYASLNCGLGSDDDRAAVQANRARVAEALGQPADRLVTVHQVHSPDVVTVREAWSHDAAPKADAMVTDVPGIALGVLAADCAPLLFADAEAGVIGAAHSGWKGALYGVLGATVMQMERLGAKRSRIRMAIGPCIGPDSYEVSDGFVATFIDKDAASADYFAPAERDGHAYFDLPGYLLMQARRMALADAGWIGADTLPDEAQFFSYRRTTLNGGGDYGRMISAIVLDPARN